MAVPTVDCGATTKLTESLNNIANVQPKVATIRLAMAGATLRSPHFGKMIKIKLKDKQRNIMKIVNINLILCQGTESRSSSGQRSN